jgi:hypothetical protein
MFSPTADADAATDLNFWDDLEGSDEAAEDAIEVTFEPRASPKSRLARNIAGKSWESSFGPRAGAAIYGTSLTGTGCSRT